MRLRAALISTLAAAVAALSACGGGDDAKAPATASVRIADFKFKPPVVTIRAGGTVRFANADRAEHTATLSGGFDTAALRRGQSKSVVLRKAGRFVYRCDFHPFMKGTVVVE